MAPSKKQKKYRDNTKSEGFCIESDTTTVESLTLKDITTRDAMKEIVSFLDPKTLLEWQLINKNFYENVIPNTFEAVRTDQIVSYEDGSIYKGYLRNGARDGKGKMENVNGDIYEGGWKNGTMHGQGKMEYANGERYEGDWLYHRRHGHGEYRYKNGHIYVGQWEDNKPHGQGTMKYENGDIYEGEWRYGERHGDETDIEENDLIGETYLFE